MASGEADCGAEWPESILMKLPSEAGDGLRTIPERLKKLREDGRVDEVEMIVQALGTAAGRDGEWREQFRDAGILQHVIQELRPSAIPVGLARQYLRVIGNCVVDNEENRGIILEILETITACLDWEPLALTALVVILNLCNDYDPAQVRAADLRLDQTISERLTQRKIPEDGWEYATELLTCITEKLTPAQLHDSTSINVFKTILDFAVEHKDRDIFESLVPVLAHYLQDPAVQQQAAAPEILEKIIDVTIAYEGQLTQVEDAFLALASNPNDSPNDMDDNVIVMVELVNSLSAIAGTDEFVKTSSLSSPHVRKVSERLVEGRTGPFTICACVLLGNITTSDGIAMRMVQELGIHAPLLAILSQQEEPALLYAAAGFMRHLSYPESNRAVLAKAGLVDTCCHLLSNNDPSVRGEGAAVLAKLVSSDLAIVEQVITTKLDYIVTQALAPSAPAPSTAMKNAMIELGRAIVNMLRYLSRPDTGDSSRVLLRHALETPLVARPVARLIRQRFFAEPRSEGLLGLGLMAQVPEGAVCVVQELKEDGGVLEAIKEVATEASEKSGGAESSTVQGRNLQNTLVLLHALVQNAVSRPRVFRGFSSGLSNV
ncbi:ARM repeat-containing protein [Westerdykella ornata]|uniref:ARM repeat-containing protein n=1 Tax=Westerdykella ornata TaxID=318751 RepID=A0A6A6J5Z4_WESOR|nr:ARM repeat-containing protein [Westerdykella ornata]KAF2271812.1 ARM repeat-containing protein [Westerdykella ornata]